MTEAFAIIVLCFVAFFAVVVAKWTWVIFGPDRVLEERMREVRIHQLEQWLDNWDAAAMYDEARSTTTTAKRSSPDLDDGLDVIGGFGG